MKYWLSACGLISAAMADPQAMLVGGVLRGKGVQLSCYSAPARHAPRHAPPWMPSAQRPPRRQTRAGAAWPVRPHRARGRRSPVRLAT